MLNRLATVLNFVTIPVSAQSSPWVSLARAIVGIQVLFLCSHAARATDFNFGFDGAPRPSQEATLIVEDLSPRKFGVVVDIVRARVFSVDGKSADKLGSQLSSRGLFAPVSHCETDCTIRLLPGVHLIEVNFASGGYPVSHSGTHNQVVAFTAKPGKKYRLLLAIGGDRWAPIVREVSTFAAGDEACAADIKAQCADVKSGGGALKDCMKTHFSNLSEDCQVAFIRATAVGKACRADVKQFCADVKPGRGAIADCMKSHAADLSDGCKEAMAKAQLGGK
jgi:hypothetical protein